MKIFNLLLCSAAVSAVTTACDENLIGNSIIETESHLIVDSAYTISGESVAASKIRSRTISQLLGRLYAEEYGSLQSITVENLHHILNLWIQGTGASTYPELSFRSWEKGESLPAILVSP